MAAAFWVSTSVCPCIENIVGTGLLKTTAGKRGLTFILLCTIFFFASANLEVFLQKKKFLGGREDSPEITSAGGCSQHEL